MMKNNFLPLGSIVQLNSGSKKLMITGYLVSSPDYPDQVFDYCGCMYPEEIVRSDTICIFNHSEIIKIIFKGYLDLDEKKYLELINDKKNLLK